MRLSVSQRHCHIIYGIFQPVDFLCGFHDFPRARPFIGGPLLRQVAPE
jgi:hypothetical protein